MLRQIGCAAVIRQGELFVTTEEERRRLTAQGAVNPAALRGLKGNVEQMRIEAALRAAAPPAEFSEMPLKDVIDYFRDATNLNIVLDLRTMKNAGIDADEQTTVNLKGIPFDAVLKQILGKHGLKYVVRDEVIFITPVDPTKGRAKNAGDDAPEGAKEADPHPDERAAVDRLDQLGADVQLDGNGRIVAWHLDSVADGDAALAAAPRLARLRVLRDSEWPDDGSRLTDRGVAQLRSATQLMELSLHGDEITDKGIAMLAGLTNLRVLDLSETGLTDAGLRHLAGLANLGSLNLRRTRIDGAGLAALGTLRKLKRLDLEGTLLVDASLKHVARFAALETLDLSDTKIEGGGLADLATLPRLGKLDLGRTRIRDDRLASLSGLQSLRSLRLNKTGITDEGLRHIGKLLKLKRLELDENAHYRRWIVAPPQPERVGELVDPRYGDYPRRH